MTDLRLEPLSATTIVAANSLTLKPGQEQYAQPVSHSMWESAVSQTSTWPRVVLDGDEVVGFIVGNFDADADQEELRSCIWRLNVSGTVQGRGIGRFAVHALAAEAKDRGFERLTVIFEQGADGPEPFFTAIGFEVVGETPFGEAFAAITL